MKVFSRESVKPGFRYASTSPCPGVLPFLLLLFVPVLLAAQVNFSGELTPEVVFNIPGEDDYISLLNPGNALGFEDLMFRNGINLKLNESGETGALDLWIRLGQYPIAEMLVGTAFIASGFNQVAADYTADLAWSAEPYLYTADILRANASWIPAPDVRITLGRQSFLTGYGYGWNPVDLANPPKDPRSPQAYLRGVDGLTFRYSPAAWFNASLYGLIPPAGYTRAYEDLLTGGELTFYAAALEIKLSGLYGSVEKESDPVDLYPHAVAAAFYLDIAGVGVYGEGVVRSRSRRNIPDAASFSTTIRKGPVPSGLFGLEYYFPSGAFLAVEYFYNGEGWNQAQREDYASVLSILGTGITGEYYALYTPSYFAQHYALLNLLVPWYDVDASFNLNFIWSPDSEVLFFTSTVLVNLNYEGTLVTELWYTGQVSLDDDRKNEALLSPVKHSIRWNLRYYF